VKAASWRLLREDRFVEAAPWRLLRVSACDKTLPFLRLCNDNLEMISLSLSCSMVTSLSLSLCVFLLQC